MTWSTSELGTSIPCELHGPFFHDPFFTASWAIIDKKKKEYAEKIEQQQGYPPMLEFGYGLPIDQITLFNVDGSGRSTAGSCDGSESLKNSKSNGNSDSMEELVEAGAESYQVLLDVLQFGPNEINIRKSTDSNDEYGDDVLIVEGCHEERLDQHANGFVSRAFRRKYKVPAGVDTGHIGCHLSTDGILQIILPRIQPNNASTTNTELSGVGVGTGPATILDKMNSYIVKPIVHVLPDFHLVPFWKRFLASTGATHPTTAMLGIQSNKNFFKVLVDVAEFEPEELSIKCTDYFVSIEAKHEDKSIDRYGSVARQFTRTYDLPKCVSSDDLECNLLAGGILEITGKKLISAEVEAEKQIPRIIPLNITWDAKATTATATDGKKGHAVVDESGNGRNQRQQLQEMETN